MRIAVWWNLPVGGARRALRDHLRGLAERGHELHVVRPPVATPEIMGPDEFASSVTVIPLRDFSPGEGYLGRAVAEVRRARGAVGSMDRHSALAGAAIRELKPDVLFASTCALLAAPSVVRHVGDLPRVVYLQEPKRSLYEAMPDLPWVPARSLRGRLRQRLTVGALGRQARVERENAEAAGTILVNSRFSRESVRRAYGLDSEVCYLGVDADLFSPGVGQREGFVLGVGALAPSKGVREAAEACALAKLPLVCVAPFEDPVYAAAIRREFPDIEIRIGISDAELIRLYRRCLALVATAQLEPFGYTPIEAGACGAPVVALAQGGFRESVLEGDTGILADDLVGIAAGLQRLAGDPALAREMGAAGRRNALERWSLERETDRIEAVLVREVNVRRG